MDNPRRCRFCGAAADVPLDGYFHCPNCLINQFTREMKPVPSVKGWNTQHKGIINAWHEFVHIVSKIMKGEEVGNANFRGGVQEFNK